MKKNIANAWEERGKLFKDSKKAVMEQAFPPVVNEYIESIHLAEIEKLLQKDVKTCLDVGCGYGRVASTIAKKNPGIFIYGIDISKTFVTLFNSKLKKRGKAVVGDIRKLPFKDDFFDLVWVVVSFMYLEKKSDQKKGMREIFRVLKPGGKVILIEPNSVGVNIVRLWGFVTFLYRTLLGKSKVETFGISFFPNSIDTLVSYAHGQILYKRGYPILTLFLLSSVLIGRVVPLFTKILLALVGVFDKVISNQYVSYFVTYVAIKKI